MAEHEVGRFLGKRAVVVDAIAGAEVEVDARVHAAVTEVAVQRNSVVAVSLEQRLELAQVLAELLRWNS